MQGTLGLEMAQQHRSDLVLLDLDLPDMPEEEVLRRARVDPSIKDIPIVILSAATDSRSVRLLSQGARACLSKPLDYGELSRVLRATIEVVEPDDRPSARP